MASPSVSSLITTKAFRVGTDRSVPPEHTVERVIPMLKSMGITRVANITGLDRIGVPVVAVVRPNSRSVAVAQGKGVTLAAARASGVMESIEAYHAENIRAPLILGTARELKDEIVDIEGLPRLAGSHFHFDLKLLWMWAQDWQTNKQILVPYELVHLDFTRPFPTGAGAFVMSSNGLASGNNPLEALSHGITEVVERDANALWRFSDNAHKQQTRVDTATVDDDVCRALLEKFREANIHLVVWETTSDIGIPSFMCCIADRQPDPVAPLAPAYGSGCHPRRAVALSRALTEAAQGRLTMISGSRDDLGAQVYTPAEVRARLGRFHELATSSEQRRFDVAPNLEAATTAEDVAWELLRLSNAGINQVAVVELTKPEFGVDVARVIIPGLESISEMPEYVPGARARLRREQRRQ